MCSFVLCAAAQHPIIVLNGDVVGSYSRGVENLKMTSARRRIYAELKGEDPAPHLVIRQFRLEEPPMAGAPH